MRIHRFLSLTDLIVALLVAIVVFLPKRPLEATDAYRLDPDARADLAAAEATALAHPDDGGAASAFATKLAEAGQMDWAVETARDGAAVATPGTRWKALLALSDVYGKRIQVDDSYDAAKQALGACTDAPGDCPDWEKLKLELYMGYLEAGMKSGIDPRKDPAGFRKAADGAMDLIDVHGTTPGK